MKLSKRQQDIIDIVKSEQPLSGEKIAELLNISRATLRSDLSFLTLAGILEATPKIGYTYSGQTALPILFMDAFKTPISEVMRQPILIESKESIHEAITALFMYDADTLYVIDQDKHFLGMLSRKDLLRASLNQHIQKTPVAVCMTRRAHLIEGHETMILEEAATYLEEYEIESLPILSEKTDQIVGTITGQDILNHLMNIMHHYK